MDGLLVALNQSSVCRLYTEIGEILPGAAKAGFCKGKGLFLGAVPCPRYPAHGEALGPATYQSCSPVDQPALEIGLPGDTVFNNLWLWSWDVALGDAPCALPCICVWQPLLPGYKG